MKPTLLLSLIAFIFSLACSSNNGEQEETKPLVLNLGVVQSQTGAAAIYGRTAIQGIELAIKQHEDAGLQIEYTVLDDKSTPDGGNAAFTSLVSQKVNAIIGPTLSGVALASQKISQQAGIPTLGATTTAEGITDTGTQVFRTALAESAVVPPVLAYVTGVSPIKQAVLILDSTDTFSASSAAAMKKGLQAINGNVALEIDVSKQKDVVAAIAGLQGTQIDAFLVTSLINESGPIVKSIRSAGYKQTIIGGNSFNTLDLVNASGGAVNGAYVGASWNPGVSNTMSKKFVEDYTKAYGAAPDLYAAQGYAAVEVLVAAVRKAGTVDAEPLRTALASTKDLDTVFGKISMSDKREAQYAPVVQQFQDGKLIVVR